MPPESPPGSDDTDTDAESYQTDLERVFTDPDTTTPESSATDNPPTPGSSSPSPTETQDPDPPAPGPSASEETVDASPTETPGAESTPEASGPPGSPDDPASAFQRLLAGGRTVVGRLTRYVAKKVWGRSDPERGLSGLYYPSSAIGDDEIIFSKTPSRWRSAGPYLIAFTLIAAALLIPVVTRFGGLIPYLNSRTPSFITISHPPLGLLVGISGVFFLLGGLLVVSDALRRASTWLVLTDSKLIYRTRILDTELSEIRLQDINKTETLEPFPQKLVNLGDIILYTASTDEYELKFRTLKHPQRQSDRIETTRAALTDHNADETP
jgi:hypothetical protein